MGRLTLGMRGLSLMEFLAASVLLGIVVVGAFTLMVNFANFSFNVVRSEESLMATALGAYEEIIKRISLANDVKIPATTLSPAPSPGSSSIEIRSDVGRDAGAADPTPADYTDDAVYTYWQDGTQLKRKRKRGSGPESPDVVIAGDIVSIAFTRDPADGNRIQVDLEAQPAEGPKEILSTVAIMRSRSAQQ